MNIVYCEYCGHKYSFSDFPLNTLQEMTRLYALHEYANELKLLERAVVLYKQKPQLRNIVPKYHKGIFGGHKQEWHPELFDGDLDLSSFLKHNDFCLENRIATIKEVREKTLAEHEPTETICPQCNKSKLMMASEDYYTAAFTLFNKGERNNLKCLKCLGNLAFNDDGEVFCHESGELLIHVNCSNTAKEKQ